MSDIVLFRDGKLDLSAFDPECARMLGDETGEEFCRVVTEASARNHAKVLLRHWFYCLAQQNGSRFRKGLLDAQRKDPQEFIDVLEESLELSVSQGDFLPDEMSRESMSPEVEQMLAKAAEIADTNDHSTICEEDLTLALFGNFDGELQDLVTFHFGGEKAIQSFLDSLSSPAKGRYPELFLPSGELNQKAFTYSGLEFCKRLLEDASSLGIHKITTRHMAYTLLANEKNILFQAFSIYGVKVKDDLHIFLSRELSHPGAKRNVDLRLNEESMFALVQIILREAVRRGVDRGAGGAAEFDICLAYFEEEHGDLARYFPPTRALDCDAIRKYMEAVSADDFEAEAKTYQKFTVQEIQDNISKRIRGQDAAIRRLIPWIKRLRFGLGREDRPQAVFLFLGPTGTGKTQMAKELARYVYGDPEMMVFLEMGQFKTKESMSIFIGAAPGYVGYGEGKLTNGLRERPESVVLFDEIEKADTQVFDTILRFSDEGVIGDPAGPVRDGRRCIIVMTTNAGQTWLRNHLRSNPSAREDPELGKKLFEAAMDELREEGFRPEFLGRVDERITFVPFSEKTCRKIIDDLLEREIRLFQHKAGVRLTVENEVREQLAKQAHERSLDEGARGAPRAINTFVTVPAIDLLTDFESKGEDFANCELIASLRGDQVRMEKKS